MKNSKEKFLSGALGLLGGLLVLIGLLVMNGLETRKNKKNQKNVASFNVENKKKKKKKSQSMKRRPIPKKRARPKISPPSLAGSLGGASFGLEQFEFLGEAGEGLLGKSSNVIMTEDTVDEKPKVTYRPPLEYPSYARKRSIEGFVILNLLIGTMGEVEELKLLKAEPKGVFDDVAVNSARDWQFEAASYQGKKVKIWVQQRISFNLN